MEHENALNFEVTVTIGEANNGRKRKSKYKITCKY